MDRLGIDFSVFSNLSNAFPDLTMQIVSGRENVAQAIIRRLMTPRGGLFYDPTYGTDVREWMNEAITDESLYELTVAVAAECEKDERVLEAQVSAIPNPRERSLRLEIALKLVDATEPLKLILNASAVNVEVLYAP